jgi:DNA-binding LacI/PurR family transcriptional regulator
MKKQPRNGLFGMIIPDPTNPFFMELLNCFESIVSEENHDLIFASARFDPQRVDACVNRMLMRRVDGIVLASSELLITHESIKRHAVPVVTLDRGEVAERVSDVSVDFENAMVDAIRYLKQMGHRRIAFIGGFPGPRVSWTRAQAFRRALELSELVVDERYIQEGDYRAEGGATAMARLLAVRSRPTAVLAVNDLTAIGALQLLQERGITVPLQMSIIGFDNIAMTTLVSPRLTTLSISRSKMAQMFFDALMHVRDERVKRGSLYKLRAELVVRDSVANLNAVRRKSTAI